MVRTRDEDVSNANRLGVDKARGLVFGLEVEVKDTLVVSSV